MNNDRPPASKLRKWLMGNKESTLPGLKLVLWPWLRVRTRMRTLKFYLYTITYLCLLQGGVTLTASVLRSVTAVKTKVNGQIKIFAIVNGQATISL